MSSISACLIFVNSKVLTHIVINPKLLINNEKTNLCVWIDLINHDVIEGNDINITISRRAINSSDAWELVTNTIDLEVKNGEDKATLIYYNWEVIPGTGNTRIALSAADFSVTQSVEGT